MKKMTAPQMKLLTEIATLPNGDDRLHNTGSKWTVAASLVRKGLASWIMSQDVSRDLTPGVTLGVKITDAGRSMLEGK